MTIHNNQIIRPMIKNIGTVRQGSPINPPVVSITPSLSLSMTPTPTPTPSASLSATPTPTPTLTPTLTPTPSATSTPLAEFINGDTHFDSTTGWTLGNEWTISDSMLNGLMTGEFGSADVYLVQRLEYGIWYNLSINVSALDDLPEFGGRFAITLEVEGQTPSALIVITQSGPTSQDFVLNNYPDTNWFQPGPFVLRVRGSTTGASISIDSISLQQYVT